MVFLLYDKAAAAGIAGDFCRYFHDGLPPEAR
jgi:hypothetical protein